MTTHSSKQTSDLTVKSAFDGTGQLDDEEAVSRLLEQRAGVPPRHGNALQH
jgi:hypothetical protein